MKLRESTIHFSMSCTAILKDHASLTRDKRALRAPTAWHAISAELRFRDSYHLGQTIVNDYGRPYASGFNNYTGPAVMLLPGVLCSMRAVKCSQAHLSLGIHSLWLNISPLSMD